MSQTIVEILIDKSGSMGFMKGIPDHEDRYLIDGETRMSIIKRLLIYEILPTLEGITDKIYIRTFRGTSIIKNGKQAGDFEIDLIHEGIFEKEEISAKINLLNDPQSGGTPITAALNVASYDLEKFENWDRKIILLTDGEENGGGDYTIAAKRIESLKGIPCKIFIIGLALNSDSANKANSIASGGFININSKSFSKTHLETTLAPLKIDVLKNSIKNFQIISKTENSERAQHLINTGINSTTLTIDDEYNDNIRNKSELFAYNVLIEKYSSNLVNWLNKDGESNKPYDFEIRKSDGTLIKFIECKGTGLQKPTFYLTSNEWNHFIDNSNSYEIVRVFNCDHPDGMFLVETGNLLQSLLSKNVVPYLLAPEILKEERVFLTLRNGR